MIKRGAWDHIRPEDFPEASEERLIVQELGAEVLVKLYELFRGQNLYLTNKKLFPFIRRFIIENKNRYSPRELARLLDVDESHVYRVLREANSNGISTAHKQIDLFAGDSASK